MEKKRPFSPRISVALVTRNRPESLQRTLCSLLKQEVQPAEVIVSDDSDDAQAGEVKRIVDEYGHRYLRGPRRGLYANRNHVALACTGTHIRTMDDDHEFPARHFQVCMEAIQSDPESVWIIGESFDRDGRYICPGQLHPRGFSTTPPDPDRCWAISDGASLYPIGIFQRGIRYADYYKFGAAYLEFGSRLYWMGYRIRFLSATGVVHHHDVNARSFMDREMDRSSRLFAALCHSYLYQPSVRNKVLSCLEIAKAAVAQNGYRSVCSALSAYKDHSRGLRNVGANRNGKLGD